MIRHFFSPVIAPHSVCLHPTLLPAEQRGQMERQSQYQYPDSAHAALHTCRCDMSSCYLVLRALLLRPQPGERLSAAGPQSRIHRNGPDRKPARKRPRPFGSAGPAHRCLSARGGRDQWLPIRAGTGVASTQPARNNACDIKEDILWKTEK